MEVVENENVQVLARRDKDGQNKERTSGLRK